MEKKPQSPFSLRARKQSIRYALSGIIDFFRAEHNARIHLLCTIIVIVLGFVMKIPTSEAAILALAAGFVWVAEIVNTAIEAMMDHLSPEQHPLVKHVKDISAAAVLFSAIAAVVAGAFIFIPKII